MPAAEMSVLSFPEWLCVMILRGTPQSFRLLISHITDWPSGELVGRNIWSSSLFVLITLQYIKSTDFETWRKAQEGLLTPYKRCTESQCLSAWLREVARVII